MFRVTNDHMIGAYDVRADYAKDVDDSKMFIHISKITDITGDTIEKDDRAVIEYTKENTIWYISATRSWTKPSWLKDKIRH